MFPIPPVNFFEDDTKNLSSELENVFTALQNVDKTNEHMAKHIEQTLRIYIAETMLPKLLELEVIILLNAYILKSRPICDLFYCFDPLTNKRVMRNSKAFYNLVAGSFMVMYYKVGNIIYLKYKLLLVCL